MTLEHPVRVHLASGEAAERFADVSLQQAVVMAFQEQTKDLPQLIGFYISEVEAVNAWERRWEWNVEVRIVGRLWGGTHTPRTCGPYTTANMIACDVEKMIKQ